MLEYLRKPMRLAGLCIIITLLGTISLTSGAQFFESLPVQACANIIHEARVNDVLLTLNGSRAIFRVPHYKGGDIDLDSKLYFQWTDIQEYGRTTERCAPGVNDLIFATTLNSCRCTVTNIDKVVNGVSIAGVDMVIDQCPAPQSNVVGKASFIHTNVTITEVHNNTMPGSTADSFTYTTPYVQGRNRPFFINRGFSSPSCFPFPPPAPNVSLLQVWIPRIHILCLV